MKSTSIGLLLLANLWIPHDLDIAPNKWHEIQRVPLQRFVAFPWTAPAPPCRWFPPPGKVENESIALQFQFKLELQAAEPIQGCFNFLFKVSQPFAIFLKSLFQQKKLQQKNKSTNIFKLVIIPTSSAVSPPESSWSKLPVGNHRIKAKIDASCRSLFAFCRIGIYWHHKCNCGIFYCNHQVLESRTVEETIQRPLQENCSCRKPVLIVVIKQFANTSLSQP